MASLFRRISRDSHIVSKYSGDLAAFESGGVRKATTRIVRRQVTRRAAGPLWSRLWR